jgi:hypothetical protein
MGSNGSGTRETGPPGIGTDLRAWAFLLIFHISIVDELL